MKKMINVAAMFAILAGMGLTSAFADGSTSPCKSCQGCAKSCSSCQKCSGGNCSNCCK